MELPYIRLINWRDFAQTFEASKTRQFVFANLQKMVAETTFNELDDLSPLYDSEGMAHFKFVEYKDNAYYFEFISTMR